MIHRTARKRQEIIDKVIEQAQAKLSEKKAAMLTTFIREYYEHVDLEDLTARSILDLYGLVLSHWNFMHQRKPGEVKFRIFNPDYEENGWSSTHTVIEVIMDDMPFLVDSLRMEINRLGFTVHMIIHLGGVQVKRNAKHQAIDLFPMNSKVESCVSEATIYIEIDRQTDPDSLQNIETNLLRVLDDVQIAVADWHTMRGKAEEVLKDLEANTTLSVDPVEYSETKDFLRWLIDNHFTLLGCRDYELVGTGEDKALRIVPGSSLGVLTDTSKSKALRKFSEMPPAIRKLTLSDQILIIAKSNTYATIHRPAYTDLISVKRYDKAGNTIGERRFIGLFTSTAYNSNPKHIPFLRNKVEQVLARSRFTSKGHAGKVLLNILETFPRDDLFQTGVEELYEISMGILSMQERQRIRLFARHDIYGRSISCLVYVPRELYNTELRSSLEKVLKETLSSEEISFTTRISESVLACIHFVVRVDPCNEVVYDWKAIERRLHEVGRSWKNDLREELVEYFGEEKGNVFSVRYGLAFPAGYREAFNPRNAVFDIQHIEKISETNPLGMSLYQPLDEVEGRLHFKLYSPEVTIPISDALPVLENLGLRVIGEEPYEIRRKNQSRVWINDFSMEPITHTPIDVVAIKEKFQNAFSKVWFGHAENDRFNQLVLEAQLNWRDASLLRAYAKYFRQTGFTLSQAYIEEALNFNPELAKQLIQLFNLYFNPDRPEDAEKQIECLKKQIEEALDSVANLDQDRILRHYFYVIQATLRTNFFQKNAEGKDKPYIAIKLDPQKIPDIPLPRPMYEIFVYSPRFEGVHLRGGKVARGGLRWSDRREDFRTEILGLMKAQQVKNAVIVPQGAKGGFVPKCLPIDADREKILEEVIHCYRNFIRGLLDITDNLKGGEIIHPEDVVRYDGDDHYLVVAADKGTATFSDIANEIAREYGFWLDDGFASGGSTGYDHKKMGITARGAWESVKRHFRHLGMDTQETDFTVVGIGDMAGDVFGNGMLLSQHIKLVGAFNHLHIFLDPDPDPRISYKERKRLFALPRSSWTDYNAELISKGGGVYSRAAKAIRLSPEMKKLLNVNKDMMVPNELLRALLGAKVDLLWNGGIGTFVKATTESHADAGDRTNDAIRLNAAELQCKVVGEGGNLGLTQLSRVEFALKGGWVNSDFIDNSAGVDCSDHEVNIKILLNDIVANGDMTEKQRNALLVDMTDDISRLVLRNNYEQTQTISVSLHNPPVTVDLYYHYMEELERTGKLDPQLEFLPLKKALFDRKAAGKGFTRPEVALLLSYSKNILEEDLLDSDMIDDPYLLPLLKSAFPEQLTAKFSQQLQHHSLRREIIATQLSNRIVNDMGSIFIHRMKNETGASTSAISQAYLISQNVFNRDLLWRSVEVLDNKIPAEVQVQMLLDAYRLIQRGTRWFLSNRRNRLNIAECCEGFTSGVNELARAMPEVLIGSEREYVDKTIQQYLEHGVPEETAIRFGCTGAMFPALDVIEAANQSGFTIKKLADVYYALGDRLEFSWLRKQIRFHPVANHWEDLARSALRDEFDREQRNLSIGVLQFDTKKRSVASRIDLWVEYNQEHVERWLSLIASLRSGSSLSYTMFMVAIREMIQLSRITRMHSDGVFHDENKAASA